MDWLKLYSKGILHGSIISQLTLEEQMVWVKLLCFANESRERGVIRHAKGIPYEREELARELGITEELLNSTIYKCVQDENADDPRTRIMLEEDGSIVITNWEIYQAKPPILRAKELAIARARETKGRNDTATEALVKSVNILNYQLTKVRYSIQPDGRVLDGKTGVVKHVDEFLKDESFLSKGGS